MKWLGVEKSKNGKLHTPKNELYIFRLKVGTACRDNDYHYRREPTDFDEAVTNVKFVSAQIRFPHAAPLDDL